LNPRTARALPRTWLLAGLVVALGAARAGAQASAVPEPTPETRRHLTARRAAGPIKVDGVLDESDWALAPTTEDWMKVRPDFAPHTAFRSWARVLYDDTHLYVGSFHFDSLGRAAIRVPDLRRDFSPPDADVFGVTFGPLGDGRTVLQLSTTPYGSQADVQAFDGGASFSFSWDAMWTVRTTRSDSGWVAEMAIPWTSLRYDPTRTSWEVNFVRGIRRVGEWSAWSPYPRQFSSCSGFIGSAR